MSEDLRKPIYGLTGGIITMPPQSEALTMRDQFAMAAMQGDWANQNSEVGYFADCNDEQLVNSAKIYYRMADAMLAARDK